VSDQIVNAATRDFLRTFAADFQQIYPAFDKPTFLHDTFDSRWQKASVDNRLKYLSASLHKTLPSDYPTTCSILIELSSYLHRRHDNAFWAYMFIPDYMVRYGMDDLDSSIKAFEHITQYTSCEFAVRPFIMNHPGRMMTQMLIWSGHEHHHVRRLASEGCRPRLPLAPVLPALMKDPQPIIPVLDNMKNDDSEFVRRSVANNLNDISKDNPSVIVDLAGSWKGVSKNTDWVIKHGCRTLLKQGNSEVMQIFGFGPVDHMKVIGFSILDATVRLGGSLDFTFQLENSDTSESRVRIEYGIYYRKANGSLSRKIFKISERTLPGNSTTTINRKHSFKPMTTRKLHPGQHQLSLILNGQEMEKIGFELSMNEAVIDEGLTDGTLI
jgi:3-methyladenine DNA glycosylase AlkC